MMQKHMEARIVIGILVFVLVSGKPHKQTFKASTKFNDASRWTDGSAPCAGDSVVFDPNKKVSVFVQTNFTVTEIVLPMDGEYILDEGIMWGASPDLSPCPQGGSQAKQAMYKSDPDSWMNADSWMAYDMTDGSLVNSLDLLDIEKVPCDYDQAVFPPQNSWTVDIPLDVAMNSLTIWEKAYTSTEFATYRTSGSGLYQFQGAGRVTSETGSCSDPTGCICRTTQNAQNVEDRICSETPCLPTSCKDPLQPNGMCCDTCGALITMTYSSSYSEIKMLNEIENLKLNPKFSSVHTILSKINDLGSDRLQILMIDENTGTNYGKTAQEFARSLYETVSSPQNSLGVTSATMTSSGVGTSQQSGISGGAVAGIVIAVLCLVGLILVAVVWMNRKRRPSFSSFYKLEDETRGVGNPVYDLSPLDVIPPESVDVQKKDLTSSKDTSITGLPQVLTSDFGKSFSNPLYDEEDV